jgi:hypothetical protein
VSNYLTSFPSIIIQNSILNVSLFSKDGSITKCVTRSVFILNSRTRRCPPWAPKSSEPKGENDLYIIDPEITKTWESANIPQLDTECYLILLHGGPAEKLFTSQSARYLVNCKVEAGDLASIIRNFAHAMSVDRARRHPH